MDLLLLLAVPIPPRDLYFLGELESEQDLDTPYGKVKGLARRSFGEKGLWVLPYFGSPDRTDPRASIWAAKDIGVKWIVGWEGVIALSSGFLPGDNVIPHDYIDMVKHQPETLCVSGGHPVYSDPFCPLARKALLGILPSAYPDGVYLAVDGTFRETPSEALAYRRLGGDVMGFNLIPEAALAREAGLCFGAVLTVFSVAPTTLSREGSRTASKGLKKVLMALPRLELE